MICHYVLIEIGREHNENEKNQKVKNHVRITPRDTCGFAEHQEKATYGLDYKITLTRNSDNSVLIKANATNNAKIKTNGFDWYVPHIISIMEQQKVKSKRNLSRLPTELHYVEKSILMK